MKRRQYIVTPRAHISAALPLCVSVLASQHSGAKKWKVPAVLEITSFSSKGAFSFSETPKSHNLAVNGASFISSGKCLLEHSRTFCGLISLWIIPASSCKYWRALAQSLIILRIYFWHMKLSPIGALPLTNFLFGVNLYFFSFQIMTSLYFANSIIRYNF